MKLPRIEDIRWDPVPPTDADEKTMPTLTLNAEEVIWALPGQATEAAPSWRGNSDVVAYDDDDDEYEELDYDDDEEEDEDFDADFLDDDDDDVADDESDADEEDEDL